MDVETTSKGVYIIVGAGSDKTSLEYLRLLEMGFTVITSDEAQEAGLNIPAEILPNHGITITNAESIIPLRDMKVEPLPEEFLIKNKRGKGKHKKKYDPPYRYHR